MAEHLFRNQGVAGSAPVSGSFSSMKYENDFSKEEKRSIGF